MSIKKSLIEIHIAVLLFGLAGLFGKWIVQSPVIIVFGRVCFLLFLRLEPFSFFSGTGFKSIKQNTKIILFFLGFLLAFHWICFFQSIQISTVAVGLLSYSSFPLFTVLLEPLFSKERIEKRNVLLAIFCITGVFLIIPQFNWTNDIFRGVLWGFLSGFIFSFITIFNRKLAKNISYLHIVFFQDLGAAFCLLPFLFILKTKNRNDLHFSTVIPGRDMYGIGSFPFY